MSHIMCHVLFFFKFIFKTMTVTTVIAAIVAILVRTVVASLTFATLSSFNSGCNSVTKCAALATLDSIDVKLYELLPFCTPQL